ncbi:MAG TPA: hypothetical protein VGK81_12970 [Anaerolineae bacterium]|jgi:hypothetical protein
MADECCSQQEAGSEVCDLPLTGGQRAPHILAVCPVCGERGKPVQGQTVKALLAVSLREVQDAEYLFCRTQTCPVVYFTPGGQSFSLKQVRERVYQKEPLAPEVYVCYCFRHTVGELLASTPETSKTILDDIESGIQAEQCACDLRNPQGSCCLGNVRGLLKNQLQMAARE